jgi:hypothetical protein
MDTAPPSWSEVLGTALRVLTFRVSREELLALGNRHLAFGLLSTWIVGMGRWWDDPGARLLQHLGMGSVIYVLALSLLLWLVIMPLQPAHWSYRNVLTFVTLTSPPAILYALPVERWVDLDTAIRLNKWFLGVVALWRVSLLVTYLGRLGGLSVGGRLVGTLVPITLVIVVLSMLNLERAVFDIMGGLNRTPTPNDGAYEVLVMISMLSMLGSLPLLLWYAFAIFDIQGSAKRRRREAERPGPLNPPPPE